MLYRQSHNEETQSEKQKCHASGYGNYGGTWLPDSIASDANFSTNDQSVPGVTMVIEPMWTFNVGHGMFDELFPAFAGFVHLARVQSERLQ